MRYLFARLRKYKDDMLYRIYVTDSLYYSKRNEAIASRYVEAIKRRPVESKTADEIVDSVVASLGLEVV